jgi:hypothetical protein
MYPVGKELRTLQHGYANQLASADFEDKATHFK